MTAYADIQRRLQRGWLTCNTRSVCSHVRMPQGLAVNLCFKDIGYKGFLDEALIGRRGEVAKGVERIIPGPRSYDGTYTELELHWYANRIRIRTCQVGDEWLALVEPLIVQQRPPALVVELALLWGREGSVARAADTLRGSGGSGEDAASIVIHVSEPVRHVVHIPSTAPHLAVELGRPVVVSSGRVRTVAEAKELLAVAAATVAAQHARHGTLAETHRAMQGCLAWDTIYEPQRGRMLSTVSRLWNVHSFGGYVIFDWDTYFAGWMAALDAPDLAVANLVEITRAITADGFVPNFEAADGNVSVDRSQPPVGALAVRQVHRLLGERCLLDETFPNLLRWNRWWPDHRQQDGLLCWGADVPATDPRKQRRAMLESGLDNSPMYDLADFSDQHRQLLLADVGLTSLYVVDCEELAAIATELGDHAAATELRERAATYRANLQRCWDDRHGIFANLHTNTGTLSDRWSPTSFYPLLAAAAEPAQAQRLVREHLLNPDEFWGTWVIPSIARTDPAFREQEYWRGRIWAPMNFLVWLGLHRQPGFAAERRELADRSRALLLHEWHLHGHVHENYNANTGMGCDVASSDPFYHWGGLLGLIALMESGVAAPDWG